MEDEDKILGPQDMTEGLKRMNDNFQTPMHRMAKNAGMDVYGYGTGLGTSSYDENMSPASSIDFTDFSKSLEDYRSKKQSNLTKVGAGLARVGAKAVTEIAKMPGVLVGAAMAPFAEEGQGWETAFNNKWIQRVNEISENINEEYLPVYVKKAVKEGSLWDNITSIDFWATEGADGVGFIASMFAPGAALKAIGIGDKLFKGIKGASNIFNKTEDATQILSKMGINPQSVELGSQTIANTLFEAAAESQGAMEAFKMSDEYQELVNNLHQVEEEKFQELYNNYLQNGYQAESQTDAEGNVISGQIPTEDQIVQELRNKAKEEAQIELDKKVGEVGRNVFVTNTAILIGPNAVMTNMIWGKKLKGGIKFMDNSGEIVDEIAKYTARGKVRDVVSSTAKAAVREGFFEEGMQSTAEEYFVSQGGESTGWLEAQGNFISDLPNTYLHTISEVDGQKAIFLGAFLGGGMQSYQDVKSKIASKKAGESLLSKLKDLDSFYTVFSDEVRNEKGELDPIQVANRAKGLANIEQLTELLQIAYDNNDAKSVEDIRTYASGELMKSFIMNEDLGMDALNQYFDGSNQMDKLSKGEQKAVKEITTPIKERARKLYDDYQNFKAFAPSLLNLETKDATEQDVNIVYDKLASDYLTKQNIKHRTEALLETKKRQRGNLLKSLNLDPGLVTEDEVLVKTAKNNIALSTLNEDIREHERVLKDNNKDLNSFWDANKYKGMVSQTAKLRTEIEKAQRKENELNQVLEEIDKAESAEDLDKIKKTNTIADEVIDNAIEDKRKSFKTKKEVEKVEKIETQKTETTEVQETQQATEEVTSESIENVVNNEEVGQGIADVTQEWLDNSNLKGRNELVGETGLITETSDKGFTMQLFNGENLEVTFPKKSKSEAPPVDPEHLEGSDIHDTLTKELDKSVESTIDGKQNGAKIIASYEDKNSKKYIKFDFVSQEYMDYERNPTDKRNQNVFFSVGARIDKYDYKLSNTSLAIKEKLIKNPKFSALSKDDIMYLQKNYNQAMSLKRALINAAIKSYEANGITAKNKAYMIEFLPFDANVTSSVKAPIMTMPTNFKNVIFNKDGSVTLKAEDLYNKTTRVLRSNIIEGLSQGIDIADITTTIEGQYGGTIETELDKDGLVPENSITGLHYIFTLPEKDRMKYIQDNIAFINANGLLEFKDGNTMALNKLKTNAKGEIYLMIPSANGTPTPIKLNIQKMQDTEKTDLFIDIFELRLKNDNVNKSTAVSQLEDKDFANRIKNVFKEEINLIGKNVNDITLKDIIEFFIYDKAVNANIKTRIKIEGVGKKGFTKLSYGNSKLNGGTNVLNTQPLDKNRFKNWLLDTKRRNISMNSKNNKASIFTNIKYLEYLIENKILNTNAVTGLDSNNKPRPTFQGRTEVYLKSDITLSEKTTEEIRISEEKFVSLRPDDIAEKVLAGEELTEPQQKIYDDVQKKFESQHEKPNTEAKEEVEETKDNNKSKDSVDLTTTEMKGLVQQLLRKKLMKGGTALFKSITGNKLSNKEKVDLLKSELGESVMTELLTNCKK